MPDIYGLHDPKTGGLIYIGKADDPEKRLMTHMRDSRRRDTPLYRWIRERGMPALSVMVRDSADWKADERRLIRAARDAGVPLLNVAAGGDQPAATAASLKRSARTANAKRPKNVMRAYRLIEYMIRVAERASGHRPDLRAKHDSFKDAVGRHRLNGTLSDLDKRFEEYFRMRGET